MSFLVSGLFGGGGAAAAGGAAAGGGFSLGGLLSGIGSVFSAFAAIQQGEIEAQNSIMQAREAEFDETQEQAEGLRSTTALKRELAKAIGENDVAFAAAGIDIGFGVAAQGRATAEKDAATEINIDRSTTDARRASLRARAAGFYRNADLIRSAAGMRAFSGILSAFG